MTLLLLSALLGVLPTGNNFAQRYLSRHLQEVRLCYQDRLQRGLPFTARLRLHLVFGDRGHVEQATAQGAPDEELERCVLMAARRWSLPDWQASSRMCDAFVCRTTSAGTTCSSSCDGPAPHHRDDKLVVTYPVVLRPVDHEDADLLRDLARSCWMEAIAIGVRGDAEATVRRHVEPDGFEVVSVEETSLPIRPAVCLARAASHYLGNDVERRLMFHAYGED